jgi:hypothetical protein
MGAMYRMGGYKIGFSKGLLPILKSTVSKEGLKFDEISNNG